MPPFKPVSPKIPLNLGLAAILGLGLGVGAAFIQEHLDQTIENADDVDRYLRLPGLAFIPSLQSLNGHSVTSHTRTDGGLTLGLTSAPILPNETGHIVPSNRSGVSKKWRFVGGFPRAPNVRGAFERAVQQFHPGDQRAVRRGENDNLREPGHISGAAWPASAAHRRRYAASNPAEILPQSGSQLGSYLAGEGTWQDMTYQTAVRGLFVLLVDLFRESR